MIGRILMSISAEITKIKAAVKEIEDPSAAVAIRQIYKALEILQKEVNQLSRVLNLLQG
jgi:hypothetical protein